MENKEQKDLDTLSRKVFLEAKTEVAPSSFTSSVISKIQINEEKLVYKPLIPKVVWVIILFLLVFWFGYLLKNHFTGSSEWLPNFNLDRLFTGFNMSKSATYTILLFAFMVCVQVPLLKYYFTKRLEA